MNRNDLSEMRERKAHQLSAQRTKPDPAAESVESFLARGGVVQEMPPCTFAKDAMKMTQKTQNRQTWMARREA